jgi:peptidoglycan/xylan/chitin deacetylase (PgdA/CDA1 family)/GT2 family glycosyltransferase
MIELSIIIPTYNRADRLRRCLEALGQQTQPASDFEVIVVVDGSTDGTADMLAHMTTPFTLRVITQTKSGQCVARNRGVDIASRYCLFIDDDVIAGPDLVAEHLKAQRANGGVVAIGQLTAWLPASADWFARYFAKGWHDHYMRLNQGARPLMWRDCYAGNLSVPRDALLAVGGFAADLTTNFGPELGHRLQQHGGRFVYLPAALGEHDDYKNCRQLLRYDEQEGRMLPELIRRHPDLLPEFLGTFWDTSPRAVRLRQFFLTLRTPPYRLAQLKPLLRNEHWTWEWFRFLRAYAFWYGVRHSTPDREMWQRMMYRTPILMYHAFGAPDEKPSRFIIPARRFAQQMAWLKRMNYRVLSLEEFLHAQREHRLPLARSVVITIDDGYADIYQLAYPILQRYRFPATVFVVSERVGSTNQWDQTGVLAGRPLLAWSDLKQMACSGIQIGAHTRTHPHLKTLSREQAQTEIAGSREDAERELGLPVRTFAYPYGEYDATSQAVVEQADFSGSCGVRAGLNAAATSPYTLQRVEIRGTDSLLDFVMKLRWGRSLTSNKKGTSLR